jgi:hypothetical protein
MRMNIAWNDRDRKLAIRLAKGARMLDSKPRAITLHVTGESARRDVLFHGSAIEVKL